jgi:hypothetical protein
MRLEAVVEIFARKLVGSWTSPRYGGSGIPKKGCCRSTFISCSCIQLTRNSTFRLYFRHSGHVTASSKKDRAKCIISGNLTLFNKLHLVLKMYSKD